MSKHFFVLKLKIQITFFIYLYQHLLSPRFYLILIAMDSFEYYQFGRPQKGNRIAHDTHTFTRLRFEAVLSIVLEHFFT